MTTPVPRNPEDPAFVYRMKGQDGEPIYTGKSSRVPRFYDHSRDKDWWPEVTSIDVEHTTVGEVDRVEREAITADRPAYNVQHNRHAVESGPEIIEGEIADADDADDGPGFLERYHRARHGWMYNLFGG